MSKTVTLEQLADLICEGEEILDGLEKERSELLGCQERYSKSDTYEPNAEYYRSLFRWFRDACDTGETFISLDLEQAIRIHDALAEFCSVLRASLMEIERCYSPSSVDMALPLSALNNKNDKSDQPPGLTKPDRLVLLTLDNFDAAILVSTKELWDEMPRKERLSMRTIGPSIKRLIELDLAERPEGSKRGARLTRLGRQTASKIAE